MRKKPMTIKTKQQYMTVKTVITKRIFENKHQDKTLNVKFLLN